MSSAYFLRVLITTCIYFNIVHGQNYCKELCKPDVKHIACDNEGLFDEKHCGKKAEMIHMSQSIRDLIVRRHNEFRNQVARGFFKKWPVASRMARLQWDETLQYFAELNVKRCQLRNTECFATKKYPLPGQNLAYNKFNGQQSKMKIIKGQITMWIEEHHYADINSLVKLVGPTKREVGHFLQVIRDRADRIGCAVLRRPGIDTNFEWIQSIACKYNAKPEKCEMVYKFGGYPAQDCLTGSDREYRNLCSEDENYASNCTKHPGGRALLSNEYFEDFMNTSDKSHMTHTRTENIKRNQLKVWKPITFHVRTGLEDWLNDKGVRMNNGMTRSAKYYNESLISQLSKHQKQQHSKKRSKTKSKTLRWG